MKIACPGCKCAFEIKRAARGCHVICPCGEKFVLDDACVLEERSAIDEPAPERIGPCKIERFIGDGGMGRVYKGLHPTLGIPVAVKTLLKDFAADRNFKVRFIQSAKICAQVDHPNIVRIYDCGEDAGQVYLILEYLAGGNVRRMLDKHGPIESAKLCEIAIAVCKGMCEAARFGIVHRDIKPENIMRSRDGEYKLSDLGLAKRKTEDQARPDPSITMAFASLGTPHYMPPEQAIDAKSCDERADIYSFGVSLYEMATGKLPFDSDDPAELRKLHAEKEPVPPSKLKSDIDPSLELVILRCMRKPLAERYQSPGELMDDLLAVKEGRPLPSLQAGDSKAAPSSSAGKTLPGAEKRGLSGPSLAFVGGIALALLIALLPPCETQAPPASDSADASIQVKDAPGKRKSSKGVVAVKDSSPADAAAALRRRELWRYAEARAAKTIESGDSFDLAMKNLKAFTEDEESTEFAAEAAALLASLAKAKDAAVAKLLDSLVARAKPYVDGGDFTKAIAVYEGYAGPLAGESSAQRRALVDSLRAASAKLEAARHVDGESRRAKRKALLSEIASRLLAFDPPGARAALDNPDASALVPDLAKTLSELASADALVAESFRPQLGATVYLKLGGAGVRIVPLKIDGVSVIAEETLSKATLQRRFSARDLDLQERLARMGSAGRDAKELYAGLQILESGGPKKLAAVRFARCGELGAALRSRLEREIAEKAEADARAELLSILSSSFPAIKSLPEPEVIAAFCAEPDLPRENAMACASRLAAFLAKFPHSVMASKYGDAIVAAIKALDARFPPENGPRSIPPVRRPAEFVKTPEDLNRELIRFNKDYLGDGLIKLQEDGNAFTVYLSDKPVSDLEPLRGLPVKTLIIDNTKVSDLSPLRGAPLENLQFVNSEVRELSALEGLPLRCVAFDPEAISDKRELRTLRNMETLESIGYPSGGAVRFVPPEEFWRDLDVREPQWRNGSSR